MVLQSYLHLYENIFSSCCFVHAANECQLISYLKVNIETTNEQCDVLNRSVDMSSAREYNKFLASSRVSGTMSFQSSSVLCTTKYADRLILSNKAAFSGRRTLAVSIMHSLMKLPSVNSFPRSSNFCTIL